MAPFSENIHVQSVKFYPPLPWKNILTSMLKYLQKEHIFSFQNVSLELILMRDSEIAIYNHKYMDCTGPTNILSFPHDDNKEDQNNDSKINKYEENEYEKKQTLSRVFFTPTNPSTVPFFDEKKHSSKSKTILRSKLGTLVLSVDTLERECILYGQNSYEHAIHLLAHGLAHLLGYDHGEEMQQVTELLERNISYKNTAYTFTPVWSYCHG